MGPLARTGKVTTMKILKRLWADQSGASAAEYALILAIVGTLIAAAAVTLGQAISGAMTNAAETISNPPPGN